MAWRFRNLQKDGPLRLPLPWITATGMMQGSHPRATALMAIDAKLRLTLGMVVLSRLILFQRAQAMVAAHVFYG